MRGGFIPPPPPPTHTLELGSGISHSFPSFSPYSHLTDSRGKHSPHYTYINDLLALDACRPQMPNVLSALKPITTPLHIETWTAALANHPDAQFRHYIITGLTQGFRIGFNRACPLRSTYHNMPSAGKQASVVENYPAKERAAGHLIGPLATPSLHVNRFGVIPKGHSPGKWRLITELSHPPGGSVNDGVNPQHCSLSYVTVDTVASIVASLGPS